MIERVNADLVDIAAAATVAEFRRRLGLEATKIRSDDDVERLERQGRSAQVRTFTDGEGMVCLSGRFDLITGRSLVARLDATTQALFAESTPDTCPTDRSTSTATCEASRSPGSCVVCAHHHTKLHDHGWQIELGPNRELTIRFPDGTIHNTGPPTPHAA